MHLTAVFASLLITRGGGQKYSTQRGQGETSTDAISIKHITDGIC